MRHGEKKGISEDLVKRMQSLLASERSPRMIVDQLRHEGHLLGDIKKATAFLPLEQYHAFAELFSRHADLQHGHPLPGMVPSPRQGMPHAPVAQGQAGPPVLLHRKRVHQEKADHHVQVRERSMTERTTDTRGTPQGTFFFNRLQLLIVVSVLLLFFIWLQLKTEASMFVILVAFFPTLIILSLAILVMEKKGDHFLAYLWPVSILIIVVFYFVLESMSNPVIDRLDLGEVAALNFLVSSIILLLFNTTWIRSRRYQRQKEKTRAEQESVLRGHAAIHEKTQAAESVEGIALSIEEYTHAIEDKCKGINFVIGRVYKDKHGGSAAMRNTIKVEADLYNQFSTIKSFNAPEDREVLKEIIGRIQAKLDLLGQTENRVFGADADRLKGVERDRTGKDRIIEVLARNDKDPVKTYYESARTFCRNALSELESGKGR